MKAKQWAASLFFPIFMTGYAVFAYVWESLKNDDRSVRYAFRGGYIAFAAVGLLIIILTCALKIDTSEYFLSRIVIFGITLVAIGGLIAIVNLVNDELGYLIFLILFANSIAVPIAVFRKFASPKEWLICVVTNPFLAMFVCAIMFLGVGKQLAGLEYYAFF